MTDGSNSYKRRRRFNESNVFLQSDDLDALDRAEAAIRLSRIELESYIHLHPQFVHALRPVTVYDRAPKVVRSMARASELTNVGPMAAVAGALADLAVEAMLAVGAREAIVENGGEVLVVSPSLYTIELYAGSMLGRIGFRIRPEECPLGVGTSSATVGHALSFGDADAATIFADTATLADAAATAVCNSVQGRDVQASIAQGLRVAETMAFIRGAFIVREGYVGSVGSIPELVEIEGQTRRDEV
jgi:ApbE superfamily uncharacterized protein (UPF0280 family)